MATLCASKNFLRHTSVFCHQVRGIAILDEQQKIFERVRELRQADANYEPPKLLMVFRNRRLVGVPQKERDMLAQFGLEEKMYKMIVVKNTPEICKRLLEVKHLIRVKPLTFPQGLPKEGDYKGALLKQNGEFVVSPLLKAVLPHQLLDDNERSKFTIDKQMVKKELHRHWYT